MQMFVRVVTDGLAGKGVVGMVVVVLVVVEEGKGMVR